MRVGIIGSGFSSISAACFLAKENHEVTVFEKNDQLGGRARKFEQAGFTFDMGPSWYWMPDVFEDFFGKFGKQTSDFYDLKRLDPSYRVFFSKHEIIDVPANFEQLLALFESIESGSGAALKKFLKQAEYKYEVGIKDLVYKPGRSLTEFLDFRLLSGILKMDVFKSMGSHTKNVVKDTRLKQILDFPLLFLGATPDSTPALYSLMNYADMVLGTWYPMGGMNKIIEGMIKVAEEQGVKFKTSTPIHEILPGKEIMLQNGSGRYPFEAIVSGADYHHTETKLLDEKYRNYKGNYWDQRTFAPSSLIFYLGVDKRIENLQHHNLFFDADFALHAKEIYQDPKWPTDPLFYVCCPSKTDSSVAPEGKENLFVLIPVAPDLKDDDTTQEKFFQLVLERLESLTGSSIKDHISFKKVFSVEDFKSAYNSFKGNAYGLANTLRQTAILKPSIRNKKIKNLYYTGQLTVPGPGVPPSLISGEVVAKELIKDFS